MVEIRKGHSDQQFHGVDQWSLRQRDYPEESHSLKAIWEKIPTQNSIDLGWLIQEDENPAGKFSGWSYWSINATLCGPIGPFGPIGLSSAFLFPDIVNLGATGEAWEFPFVLLERAG